MKRIFLFFIAFMFAFAINAQVVSNGKNQTNSFTPLLYAHKYFKDNKNKTLGTPYENAKFELGEIIHNNSKQKIRKLFLRYNVFNDQIEVSKTLKSSEILGLTKNKSVYVRIKNREYHYKEYKYRNNKTKNGYLIKLTSNTKISLYKLLKKKYIDTKIAKTPMNKDIPAKFTDQHAYYLEIDEKLFPVSSSKKKTVSIFPNNQKEVKDFIGKENLSLKKEKDLIKLVNFYNTL
ncbi:hypothetical protein [Aquimarina spinulae]|uniref:hypothetical protein n=1 Tax=Aquimarina spinulae TaxID=1192023 RepID=UPI001050DCC2|nr:hypothetical protein [Aquimarina spinulae]